MKPTQTNLMNLRNYFEIPKEFVEKIAREYDVRVKRYNEIFGSK
jgi:hypothetical protein